MITVYNRNIYTGDSVAKISRLTKIHIPVTTCAFLINFVRTGTFTHKQDPQSDNTKFIVDLYITGIKIIAAYMGGLCVQ